MIALELDDLEPGMVLCRDIATRNDIIELTEGTVLTTPIIRRLKKRSIDAVFVEESPLTRQKEFMTRYQRQLCVAEGIFHETGETGQVPVKLAEQFISSALQPLLQKSGTLDFLYQTGTLDSGECRHAMNVSILSGLLAKWLHYSEDATAEIMLAGLLHDIGKVKLSPEMALKSHEELTPRERGLHARFGYELLLEQKHISENIRQAVLHHHEHSDRSGYPSQLDGSHIHPYAKIIAVMNKYAVLTTDCLAATPIAALDAITEKMFSTLDTKACIALIENLKASLIGSRVQLSDSREGTITYYAKENYRSAPLICLDDSGEILDLNQHSGLEITVYNLDKGTSLLSAAAASE